jgi:hypothetical protein
MNALRAGWNTPIDAAYADPGVERAGFEDRWSRRGSRETARLRVPVRLSAGDEQTRWSRERFYD